MSSTSPPDRVLEQAPVFPVLDTLRAVGAIGVLTTHSAFQSGDYLGHGVWGTVLSRLDIGVAVFFVLSGFLLSRPYLARAAASLPHPPTGRYYWKRLLRIYPVYAVTVVLALALIDDNDGIGVGAWVRTLLLGDIYTAERLPHGLTQMWSLAVEVAFYAVLPWLMLLALGHANHLRPRRILRVLVAMTGLSVAWLLLLGDLTGEVAAGVPMTWLPAYLTWFAVGMALALAHVQYQVSPQPAAILRLLATLGAMPGACWVVAGALLLAASTPLAGPALLFVSNPGEALTKHLIYAVIAGVVVVTGVFVDSGGTYRRVMSAGPLRHLGHISYSTFCIHLPVLYLVMGVTGYQLFGGHGLQIWALTLVTSLLASELLYRFVEKPCLRLKDLGRPARPATSVPNTDAEPATTR